MNYQQHPLSVAFPPMDDDEYQDLKSSVEVIGVQNPIIIFEGMVLDGWHRYKVSTELGMDCPSEELAEGSDPCDFVVAQNKARRHLNAAQLAMAITKVYAWRSAGQSKPALSAALKTTAELAKMAGTSERTIRQAKAVLTKGSKEVSAAIESGKIGLVKASKIAKLPAEKQAEAISKPMPKEYAVQETDDGPDEAELKAMDASIALDLETAQKIILADDALAAMVAENQRLKAEVSQLATARDGYMNQCNVLIKQVKSLKRQLDKKT